MVLIEMIIKKPEVMELMREQHKGKIPEDQRLLSTCNKHTHTEEDFLKRYENQRAKGEKIGKFQDDDGSCMKQCQKGQEK